MVLAENYEAKVEALVARLDALERENKILREENALLKKWRFGRSSERLESGQLSFFETGEWPEGCLMPATQPAQATKPKKSIKGHGRARFPDSLEREVHRHDLCEADRKCPSCSTTMVLIGEDVTERGRLIPARMVVDHYVLSKYACPHGHGIKTAPLPAGVIDGGKYGPSVYAHIVTAKYNDHRVPRRRTQQPQGRRPKARRSESCCTKDEGRPFEIGVQARVSNRLELRGSRARVVSVEGKGVAGLRQVRSKETNASEPLMTCREVFTRRRNRAG